MPAKIKYTGSAGIKAKNIEAQLVDSVGLVIRGKDCVAVIVKAENVLEIYRRTDKDINLFVWAVAGSVSEKRNFEHEFRLLEGHLRSNFSERELNVHLVHDFASAYLSSKFFNRKSDRPVALEFILGEVTDGMMVFYVIGYDGNSKKLEGVNHVSMVGRADDALRKALAKRNFANMTSAKIIKTVRPLLRRYRGASIASGFDIQDQVIKAGGKRV